MIRAAFLRDVTQQILRPTAQTPSTRCLLETLEASKSNQTLIIALYVGIEKDRSI